MKKWMVGLSIIGSLCMMGCLKTPNENSEVYLRCNATSNGRMAEIPSGYFITLQSIVYYADKTNLETWVPVCNEPECLHSTAKGISGDEVWCNGYTISNLIIQKDGKIYDRGNTMSEMPYILEISTDGSGAKKVYEMPWDEEDIPSISSQALYHDRLLFEMEYMDENGYENSKLISLEEDEQGEVTIKTLYEGESAFVFSGNVWWGIKGEDVIITDIDWDRDSGKDLWRNFWRIEGEKLVKLEIPEEINIRYSYLAGNELTYYEQNEGFYKLNLDTGETQLVVESSLQDARGYVFSNELIFEYNCYNDHIPEEEMCINMYNGEAWKEVKVPEEITSAKWVCAPLAWASDRIFFTYTTGEKYKANLCYMMLNEKNPEIVYAGQVVDKPLYEEWKNTNEDSENIGVEIGIDFDEVTIFDNEDGILKITGSKQTGNDYIVDLSFEKKDSGREYEIKVEAIVNGIQCHTNKSINSIFTDQEKSSITFSAQGVLQECGITDVYSAEEITDIELIFYVNALDGISIAEELLKKSVHIYPKGKEAAIHYTREPQDTDQILIENEYAKVTVIGYETTNVENDTPILLVENKTEQSISFSVNTASINGAQVNYVGYTGYAYVQSGACAFVKVVLGDDCYNIDGVKQFWEEYSIPEIDTINAFIVMNFYDIGKGKELGESFVEEMITLYPQGEEQNKAYVRQPLETDQLLVENESIKLTFLGYEDSFDYFSNVQIENDYAKLFIENKTDEILYIKVPVRSNNGILHNTQENLRMLLPGACYTHVVGGIQTDRYPEGQVPEICKIEFLYQVLNSDKTMLEQEYVVLYPQGENKVELYKPDIESMEEILFENEFFTIAVENYEDIVYNYGESKTYENCKLGLCLVNKTDKMLCFEMCNVLVNGISHKDEWSNASPIVFDHETCFMTLDLKDTLKNANMTELEEMEITWNVYTYHEKDGNIGELLGSKTVTLEPKE